MDATHKKDNRPVCLKMIRKQTNELEIGRYLVPPDSNVSRNPKNHCVPILDAFDDPIFLEVSYIVMPLLRPFNDPEFGAVGEVIDFVTQVLEVRVSLLSISNLSQYITAGYGIHA